VHLRHGQTETVLTASGLGRLGEPGWAMTKPYRVRRLVSVLAAGANRPVEPFDREVRLPPLGIYRDLHQVRLQHRHRCCAGMDPTTPLSCRDALDADVAAFSVVPDDLNVLGGSWVMVPP